MKIEELAVKNLSQNEVQELFLAQERIAEKYSFLKRYRNADEYRSLFLVGFYDEQSELLVIKDGSSLPICGILSFKKSADWGGNERHHLTVHLAKADVFESLASCLYHFISDKLKQHNFIAITVFDNELDSLVRRFSFKTQLNAGIYTLKKSEIDIEILTDAKAKHQTQNSDLHVQYLAAISEEFIEPYCKLFNEFQEDMPDVHEDGFVQYVQTPEKEQRSIENFAKHNRTHHCYIIFNQNQEMVAMTNAAVNNNDPRFPYQFLIGVKERYRGRGIGKWLYALMYKKLFEDVGFEMAFVAHHPKNKHAIKISEWVGYKFAHNETTYIISNQEEK
ncbi:MAG: GNAT family N-acetyltransferase [Defluviitaleaceae bacterium]|nr:GNAT family N-acetyltransferase [Defluviitaleaceae bacterium]